MDMQKKSIKFSLAILALSLPFFACEKKSAEEVKTQEASPALPDSQPVPGDLVITAKLMEIPGTFPANDLYNYAYIMKYQIVKVIKGTYSDTDILVGHYNPRIARSEIKDDQDSQVGGNVKSFQVGDIHYLVLSPMEGTWNGASEDDFFKDKRARYWASWADKLK